MRDSDLAALRSKHVGASVFSRSKSMAASWAMGGWSTTPRRCGQSHGATAHRRQHWRPGKRETLNTLTRVTSQMINILTEQNVQQSLRTLKSRRSS